MKTSEAAVGRWRGILAGLGMDESHLSGKHGPCPLCGGKDRWRFDDKEGRGTYYCGGCGPGDGMKLAMLWTGLDFKACASRIDELLCNITPDAIKPKRDPSKLLQRISQTLRSAEGINPVSLYLRKRGLVTMPGLWWSPGVTYWDAGKPGPVLNAMAATLRAPDGTALSLHLTYLTKHGQKADVASVKKIMPPISPLGGSAIRLGEPTDGAIGIAEGIETALAVRNIFGLNCWAAANATLLEQFQPPEGITAVHIFSDNDANYTGQKSAYALANRLSLAGYGVSVKVPDQVGQDFADQIKGVEYAAR